MTSSVAKRIMVLLFLMTMVLSVTAYADGPIEILAVDQSTGTGTLLGRVLVDNVKQPGFVNSNGDANAAVGTIQFHGYVGNFYVYLDGTASTGSGGALLTLSGNVQYNATGGDNIILEILDTGLAAPSPTVTLTSTVSGYAYSTNSQTPTGDLPGSASSISFNSWIDAANDVPAFGSATTGGVTTLNASVLTIPASAANGVSQQFTSGGFSGSAASASPVDLSGVNPANGYSMFSQVAINFTGSGGVADFTLTADPPSTPGTPIPEPTSLLLLGSSLLGVAVLRGRKRS